jgi:hypothetical protein
MSFDAFETGDGSPVELLTFANGLENFRFTNQLEPVTVGSFVFEPLPYTRSSWSQSKDQDDNNIRMTAPKDFAVAQLYQGTLSSNVTTVRIERFHADDQPTPEIQVAWKGQIVSLQYSGDNVEFLMEPLTKGTEVTPPDTFSAQCNAFLFESPGCLLSGDDFKFVATATSITPDGLELTFNGLRVQAEALDTIHGGPPGSLSSAELDIYWQGGHIRTGAGEIRDIIEGDVGSDPDTVRIQLPFRSFVAGEGASVFAGCNLLLDICQRKFDNAINFQGYPYIPEIDPANTELPPGSRTSPTKFAGPQ